jgi:uncharacterized protein
MTACTRRKKTARSSSLSVADLRPSPSRPQTGDKTVRCPACGGTSVYMASNPFRPFCGERCKQHDLGAWASEAFTLPEQQPQTDPVFENS